MQKPAKRKWLKVCLLFFVVTPPWFFCGCGGGKAEPVFNVSGSWFIFHTTSGTSGEQGPDLFTFTQTDNNLSGTTSQNQTLSGSVSGTDVNFSWAGSDGTSNTYTGTVSGGGIMSGTWTSSNGQSGTWHAIANLSPSVNVSGNWNIFHTTNGVSGEQGPDLFTFTQSGSGISGTTPQGQQIKGIVGSLSITFSWAGSDGATNTYTGTVTNNGTNMSGTWTSTNGQSGGWNATKNG